MSQRAHDMGGHLAGAVRTTEDPAVFEHRWEARMLGLQRAMGYTRTWSIDASRFAQESLDPDVYRGASYYQRWALGLASNLQAAGLVTEEELRAGHSLRQAEALNRVLHLNDVRSAFVRGKFSRPPRDAARFHVGQPVRTKMIDAPGHTRLPGYAQGKQGVVEKIRGCHVFPDTNASGSGECPQWLYCVRFAALDLWGSEAEPGGSISIEAFEPYLEPA